MTQIRVVAALFCTDGRYALFRKARGRSIGWWEFPGGKIEAAETNEQALVREIREELGVEIEAWSGPLASIDSEIDQRQFRIEFFLIKKFRGSFKFTDHDALVWLFPHQFDLFPVSKLDSVFIETHLCGGH